MKRGTVVVGFLDDHRWSACFGLSLRDLYLRDQASEAPRIMSEGALELRKVAGTGGIPDGRNQVAAEFLDRSDREWLFMIDTDMGFAPDTVDRLVKAADEHRRPVVGGLCFANRRIGPGSFHAERFGVIPTLYDYVDESDRDGGEVGFAPRFSYVKDTVLKVAATGAACLLVHRRALKKVRQKFGDAWFDPITHPTGLRGKPRTFSEDLSFCVRLASVDVPVHVDTGVKTVHEKGGVFLSEELFDEQQEVAAAKAAYAEVESGAIPALEAASVA